ncbi:MAG: high-affinity nickel-transporter [Candidatus Solibacter sp.]|nr:high-affinity nickel-transporter [Candidatus Solibacter sp.]
MTIVMVAQGDYLSSLLRQGDIGWSVMLLGMMAAFAFGAVHALSPGHGKTLVAAYLVGSRGTARHAIFLGLMVTFTHTISVFALGLITLYLSRFVLPETITPILGAISGLTIVWVGSTLLYRRTIGRIHLPSNGLIHHHGDGRVHTHIPEEMSVGGLIALGASGGLVPCPSALVLLLTSVSLGRVAFGLTLLVAFSLGLAVVLSGIGLAVLYARSLVPDSAGLMRSKAVRYLPIASAAFIVCVGLAMTWVSLRPGAH